jgi:hypothetical protein
VCSSSVRANAAKTSKEDDVTPPYGDKYEKGTKNGSEGGKKGGEEGKAKSRN